MKVEYANHVTLKKAMQHVVHRYAAKVRFVIFRDLHPGFFQEQSDVRHLPLRAVQLRRLLILFLMGSYGCNGVQDVKLLYYVPPHVGYTHWMLEKQMKHYVALQSGLVSLPMRQSPLHRMKVLATCHFGVRLPVSTTCRVCRVTG